MLAILLFGLSGVVLGASLMWNFCVWKVKIHTQTGRMSVEGKEYTVKLATPRSRR